MTKRKTTLMSIALVGVLATAVAYSSQRAQVFPGRNVLRVASLGDFEFWNVMQRYYETNTYIPYVDRTYAVAMVENASLGLVPICADDYSFCIHVESEAVINIQVRDSAGAIRYRSLNYGVVRSGIYTYTYAYLPPPEVAAQGAVWSSVFLPLVNVDGTPKSWTPWLSEWVFTNF